MDGCSFPITHNRAHGMSDSVAYIVTTYKGIIGNKRCKSTTTR